MLPVYVVVVVYSHISVVSVSNKLCLMAGGSSQAPSCEATFVVLPPQRDKLVLVVTVVTTHATSARRVR